MSEMPDRKISLKEFKTITRAISTYDDLHMLVNHIVESLCSILDVMGCSILLFDERKKQFFRVASRGISETYLSKGPLHVDEQYSVYMSGDLVFIKDMQNDSRVKYPADAQKEGITSMLSIPVKYRGAVLGIIRIYQRSHRKLNEVDLDSLCLLAETLGLMIQDNGLKSFFERVKAALETLPLRMLEGIK